MRIAVLTTFWRRVDVALLVIDHYADMRERLSGSGIELVPLGIVSPDDPDHAALAEALAEAGWEVVEAPNQPLGQKFNRGYAHARGLDLDAVMGSGSDDFVTEEIVRRWSEVLAEGADYMGVLDMLVVRKRGRAAIHWTGYQGEREGEAVGPGRCLSAGLLDAVGWEPYDATLGRGLDGSLMRRITSARPGLDVRTQVVSQADLGGTVLGYMTEEEQISAWWNNRLSPGAEPMPLETALARLPAQTSVALTTDMLPRVWGLLGEPKVSLSMIAKVGTSEEMDALVASIDSAWSAADEVVVVLDDRSMPAARGELEELGVRVFERRWDDDFSAARNFAAARCRGEWLLILDADELLLDADVIREAIATADDHDGIACEVRCIGDDGPAETGVQIRAHRRVDTITWIWPVHNELRGVQHARVAQALVESSYVGTLAAKLARSMPMMETAAARWPDEPRWPMLLARGYRQLGRHTDTVEQARRCLELSSAAHLGRVWVDLAFSTLALKGHAAAEAVIAEGLKAHPAMPDLRHARMTIDAAVWMDACNHGGARYMLAGQESVAHVQGLPLAAQAIGLPLQFRG